MFLTNTLCGVRSVVVAGAGGGIGTEFVTRLAAALPEASILAGTRDPSSTAALQCAAREHPGITVAPLDVTDEASLAAAAAQVRVVAGRLDLLIDCAGVLHDESRGMRPERRLEDLSATSLAHAFAVNATGAALLARHFAPLLPRRERCVVANLSARVGSIEDNRLGGWYAYRASKAAQNMITRCLAIELRRRARGAIVVALHPGTTDTALSAPFQGRVPPHRLFTPRHAVERLLGVLDGLQPPDNGTFRAWDGARIPW
jgi:NAD(P)-dependent dehydrogenase (short-subunit alcohol dehydrogenase family)